LKCFMLLFMTLFLLACRNYENQSVEMDSSSAVNSSTGYSSSNDNEKINLKPKNRIFQGSFNNQLVLMDLTTGEQLATHEFLEEQIAWNPWKLDNGYFVTVVHWEDLFSRSRRLGIDMSEVDTNDLVEGPRQIVVFDSELNYMESFEFDELEAIPDPNQFLSIGNIGNPFRWFDGELFLYGETIGLSGNFITGEIVRYHVRTGQVETLFQHDLDIGFEVLGFLEGNQLAVVGFSWPMGIRTTHAGILDLERGEFQLLEREEHSIKDYSILENTLLITENATNDGDLFPFTHEVIVANLQTLEEVVVPTQAGDSIWVQLTLDGQGIMTVNEEDRVLRQYDWTGQVVVEVVLPEVLPEFVATIEIFPLTEDLVTIHVIDRELRRHVQFVNLNGGD